ncbi:MAG: OmpA family protein [Gammaproteobacteria bacterium]|nr:OmpA family protein [Gammaproteobacteria bacterium]
MIRFYRIIIICFCFLLASCIERSTVIYPASINTTPQLPISKKFVAPVQPPHTLVSLTKTLETTFSSTSIQVLNSPDHVTLILPSYYVFINERRINKHVKPHLQDLIAILKAYQPRSIEIIGYTDNEDGFSQNLIVSKDWANTIMKYLVRYDIPRENITVLAHGSLRPITTNYTSAGRFQNRRVEILSYM